MVKAARADLSNDLLLTAEFEPFQEVDVMAKVSGYIKEIKVDIGDRVREGQLLATLEIPEMQDDLTRAAAAIDEANAELATARDELQRAQSSHDMAHLSYSRVLDVSKKEPGLVPQQDVEPIPRSPSPPEPIPSPPPTAATPASTPAPPRPHLSPSLRLKLRPRSSAPAASRRWAAP